MNIAKENLPEHMQIPTKLGNEISVTGKWLPKKKGSFFKSSSDAKEMVSEWEAIHDSARNHVGILSTEIDTAIGEEAVLVHHIFDGSDSLTDYFETTASEHLGPLTKVAKPDIHLVRGIRITDEIRSAIESKGVDASFGEYLFGYVKNEGQRSDPANAIQVTAKWTCKEEGTLEELIHWWNQVGTDAFSMEKGLVRYEVFQVVGEKALIIHETFETTDELKFHLTKGTAAKYKKNIDAIAFPENYFFRGPVSWMIRTYSKFMHLPATYTRAGKQFVQPGGSNSEGRF